MLMSIVGFLAILGPLVVVHELGHFLFAKLFNVKAEMFSIGFGPKLFSKKWGETEFCVSAIPLGGFVKLLGEESGSDVPASELKRSLPRQAPWKRFFIFFGGPLFNFIFAALVFMAIVAIGEPQVANIVGRVLPRSDAQKAGLESGDRIVDIEGTPVRKFSEISQKLSHYPEKEVSVSVERTSHGSTQTLVLKIKPSSEKGFTQYGEVAPVGRLDGMLPFARSNHVGVSNPQSFAGRAGIKTGQMISEWNGKSVQNWEQLEDLYSTSKVGQSVSLVILPKKGDSSLPLKMSFAVPANKKNLGSDLGLYSSEMFIEKTVDGSPALNAGLQSADRIVQVGGDSYPPISSFFEMKERIQNLGEKSAPIPFIWERAGKTLRAQITPTLTEGKDVLLNKTVTFTVGVVPMLDHAKPETIDERISNPVLIVYEGTRRMLSFTWRNLVSIGKMVTGDVSVKSLGGPILIGKLAGDSLERGLIDFLTTMAILSVGLGILNVLPIPVLDGGHLLLLGIEVVRRKPLTVRQMEIVQQVGLSLILLLMVVVFRNDLMRL